MANAITSTQRDLKGLVPETWCCVDCGTNTAPGFLNRADLEAAMIVDTGDAGVPQTLTSDSEVYTVREAVWTAAGMEMMGRVPLYRLSRKAARSRPAAKRLHARSSA